MVLKTTTNYRYHGVLTILVLYTSYSYSFQLKYNNKSNIILNTIGTFVEIIIINNYEQKNHDIKLILFENVLFWKKGIV